MKTILIVLAAVIFAAAGGYVWLGTPAGDDGQVVLRIASQKGGSKALLIASGALEGASYRVEWSEFAAAAPLLEAVASDSADIGAVGDAPFLFAYASGARIKAVQAGRSAGGGASTAIIVPSGSTVQTLQDLKGRKVAAVRGSIGHYLLLRQIEKAGLGAGDVEIVFLSPGDSKAAFSTGAIDAWATWNPFVGAAVLHEGARIVADGQGILTGLGFQAASDAAIRDKRDALFDLLRRLRNANVWAADNPDAYAQVLAKETGLPLDVARYTIDRQRSVPTPIDDTVIAEEQETLAQFVKAGVIPSAPDITGAFDRSFNAAADNAR